MDNDANRILSRAEALRSRARELQRQRRQALTAEQREAQNARRRENYRTRRALIRLQQNDAVHEQSAEERTFGTCQVTPMTECPFDTTTLPNNQHEASTSNAQHSNLYGADQNNDTYNIPQPQAQQAPTSNFTDDDADSDTLQSEDATLLQRDSTSLHNIARDFTESRGIQPFTLNAPSICQFCQALLFQYEQKSFCCRNGKLLLPAIPVPPALRDLFTEQTTQGRSFRRNIRAYNHVFSFTSMGVTLDKEVSNAPGVPTFRAHGGIYHLIGSLLPSPGTRPRYLQMFIYDTDQELDNRLEERNQLDRNLIQRLRTILDAHNPFVKTLRHLAQRPDLTTCQLRIKERPAADRQYIIPTESQVAAVICNNDDLLQATNIDIVVQTIGGRLLRLKEYVGYYDPLQYPLLLPYGSYGWDTQTRTIHGRKVTCCDFYSYMLQIRLTPSILIYGGRLFHQYVVDNYVKIETQRLAFIRTHQQTIRAELYQGLQDSLHAGETNAANVGHRTILPSSFNGCQRDMYQRFQDAMAVVQHLGKPHIFLTMTCNPNWKEIQDHLLPGQSPQDRPDLLTRIFRAKFEKLKRLIYLKGVLGKVIGHVHVVEFQKRGLPHVHMLLILDENDAPDTPDQYDKIVSAEIPDKETQPLLYEAVLKHMIHGPCGLMNTHAPCMKDGEGGRVCKKNFPKQFQDYTVQGNDSYPLYRRRNNNTSVSLDGRGEKVVDNRWVVPYNPWLLLKFNCHINVEICGSIKSIKYLYKYIHKGPDRAEIEVHAAHNYDEIQKYVDGRYICAPEALWRTFKFPITRIYPTVVRLQLHLEDMHLTTYNIQQGISNIVNNERNQRTMLTEFFRIYTEGEEEIKYLYVEFPQHYRWDSRCRKWEKRRTTQRVIGRIYAATPSDGERFYLRILLNHVRGPKSFSDLRTVNGVTYNTFKEAAEKMGLLEEDDSIHQCLMEARMVRMPSALRRLFATILIFCEPTGVRRLWDENYNYMVEDYNFPTATRSTYVTNRLLHDINIILLQHRKNISQFDLPQITGDFQNTVRAPSLVEQELTIPISDEDLNSTQSLNDAQMNAFTTITRAIATKSNATFFVDGPGGTGKTFLYRALLASSRKNGNIVLATATSGIAANQLPGGRTTHSRFRIPIKINSQSVCNFSKQSDMCELLRRAPAVIWDEAPMANKNIVETIDRTFRDMLDTDLPFGGKVMIFGGDFRQVLPVVVGGTRLQTVQASIVESHLWPSIRVLKLVDNIRAQHDQAFSDFVLRVGNGEEHTVSDEMIRIPDCMVIPWQDESSIDLLIDHTFPALEQHFLDVEYMMCRAMITPLNDDVNKLNDRVLQYIPAEEVTFYSFDSIPGDTLNLFLPEFMNSLSPGNLPPHKLTLKKGCLIMLLWNIDPKNGLCNGTRLMCHGFGRNFIDAQILTGQFKGTRVFLPRIRMKTSEDAKLPFEMTRKQFPVRLAFALTINKSQGQTIPNVGIYLPDHVFSHGQLYVALSRGISQCTTKVLVKKGNLEGHEGVYTRNVVYRELFTKFPSA